MTPPHCSTARSKRAAYSTVSALALSLALPTAPASATDYGNTTVTDPAPYTLTGSNNFLSGSTFNFDVAQIGTVDPAGTVGSNGFIYLSPGASLNVQSGVTINAKVRPSGTAVPPTGGNGITLFNAASGSTLNFAGTAAAPITIVQDDKAASLAAGRTTGYEQMFAVNNGATFSADHVNATLQTTGASGALLRIAGPTNATAATISNSYLYATGTGPGNRSNQTIEISGAKATLDITNSYIYNNSYSAAGNFRALNIAGGAQVTASGSTFGTQQGDNPVIYNTAGRFDGTNIYVFSLAGGAIGVISNSGGYSKLTDSTTIVQGARGVRANGAAAGAPSTIELNNVSVYSGVKLGTDIANAATFGKPVDVSGNLITGGPNAYVAAPDQGATDTAAGAYAGGHLIINGSSLRMYGGLSFAVMVEASDTGSVADVTNTTILSDARGAYGAHALSNGVINLTDTTITTRGDERPYTTYTTPVGNAGTFGVNAVTGGQINMTRGSIATSGRYANAVVAGADWGPWTAVNQDDPAGPVTTKITLNGTTISTSGQQAIGAAAALGATVELNNSPITTSGSGSVGIYTERAGILNFNGAAAGTDIKTGGDNAHGVQATSSGVITVNNAVVTTSGANAVGMFANDAATTITGQPTYGGQGKTVINATASTVSTTGTGGHGVYATQGGIANLNKVGVTTTGANAHGLNVDNFGIVNVNQNGALGPFAVTVSGDGAAGAHAGVNGTLNLKNGTITQQTGTGGFGMMVDGNGKIVFDTGTVTATGPAAAAIRMAKLSTGSVSASNATLTSSSGPAIVADGSSSGARVDLTGSTVSGNGTWLDVHANGGPASLVVSAGSSHLTGAALTDATSFSDVALAGNTLWDMTGSSNVSNLTNDNSLIQYAAPTGDPTLLASYKTLTTVNYTGVNGRIGLNTYLGNDSVPSDRLVINGGAGTGTTKLLIANTTGGGALTTADGILVVDAQNSATTTTNAFSLGNRVAAGAYEYDLYRGGASNANSWYLRSVYLSPPPPPGPPSPPPPPPPPGPGPDLPKYRVEVPTDSVLPALANRLGLGMLGTYRDRVGEDYADPQAPAQDVWCKDPAKNFRCTPTPEQAATYQGAIDPRRLAAWGRVFGETGKADFGKENPREALDSFLDHGPSYDFTMGGLQAGMDLLRKQNEDGSRDIAGLYLGYGHASADVDWIYGGPAGTADMNAYSLGGYWTHIGAPGWYVDAVLQGTRYNQAETDSVKGEHFDTNGWGIAASLEGGYPFALGNGWTLEPQAQLIYQHVTLDDGTDSFARISFADTDALYGRLGGRLARNWATAGGRRMTGWVHANAWSSFGAQGRTTFAGLDGSAPLTFATDLGGSWASVGLGLSAEVAENVSVFGSGDYNVGLSSGDFSSWSGRVGLKVKW